MVRPRWLARAVMASVMAAVVSTLGACVSAPSRIDVAALVKKHGAADARHELEVRIVDDPTDVAARLALAKLSDEQGRPSQALEQLEAVVRIGGPLGTRWHDDDRARLARLLHARGRARIARGAPSAIRDLERARDHGARVADAELAAARRADAIARVRHIAERERAAGLAALRAQPDVPRDRGELGAWLWTVGAKRAAWSELAAWHAATPPARRTEALQSVYLAAYAWWTPVDGPPPPASDLVGPARCRYLAARCEPWDLVQNGIASDAIAAFVHAPPQRTSDPAAAYGWLAITLGQALRGEAAWGPAFAARVELAALANNALPDDGGGGGRAAFARLAGRDGTGEPAATATPDSAPPAARMLAAAALALRGASADAVRAQLGGGPLADTPEAAALVAVVADPTALAPVATPQLAAITRYVEARLGSSGVQMGAEVAAIVTAYAIDPARADRAARDTVATATDDALGHAIVGTVFDALADPARARAAWHAAVASSPREPLMLRGLAYAVARANDPDAALIFATHAAAASGDPAPVWITVAEILHAHGSHAHALEAARFALDLASADTIARAFDIAIAASEALGRHTQAASLRARRAAVAPPPPAVASADDPTDPATALASANIDRQWIASRWNPRDVALRRALLAALPATDPRRNAVVAELVTLAADADVERARAALRALRAAP